MNSSLYIGASGMKGLAQGMQVTSNNLANVSTIGFKQQHILFSDLISQDQANTGEWWDNQDDSKVAVGQVGMGLQVEAVRTLFKQGPVESTNTMSDLAINGKGFFQVSNDAGDVYYTRAGDFSVDSDGVWRNPSGYALNGYKLNADGSRGELTQVQVDKFTTVPAKATTSLDLTFNLSTDKDVATSEENPYFGLLESYNGASSQPMQSGSYSSSQTMTIYDGDGNARQVTAYFDSAPSSGSQRYMEFIMTDDNFAKYDADGNLLENESGDGLLMAGVLEFDSTGKLVNISAFSPSVEGSKDLKDWVPAEMSGGNPVINVDGNPIAVNFGLSAASGWADAPASAAEIGADASKLPGLGDDAIATEYPTTAYKTTSGTNTYKQDGYKEGALSNMSMSSDGKIIGYFDNGQTLDLWEVPLARFTSEDNLYREGGNLFAATEGSGEAQLGTAGTENYGDIQAYNIEGSNVDMAQEFVNMILTQRGFQSNSKVVTTSDELLQKAIELKRS